MKKTRFCKVLLQPRTEGGRLLNMVVVVPNEDHPQSSRCLRCDHRYDEHDRHSNVGSHIGCGVEGCKCEVFTPVRGWLAFMRWKDGMERKEYSPDGATSESKQL